MLLSDNEQYLLSYFQYEIRDRYNSYYTKNKKGKILAVEFVIRERGLSFEKDIDVVKLASIIFD
jgi:hypothetical protein